MSYKSDNYTDAREREIRLFVRSDGACPFEEWIRGLRDKATKARIFSRIDRLRLGNFGDCRSVGEGAHELRIHHGPGLRVYFTTVGSGRIILLCAGTKRTQAADITRARTYARELRSHADTEL